MFRVRPATGAIQYRKVVQRRTKLPGGSLHLLPQTNAAKFIQQRWITGENPRSGSVVRKLVLGAGAFTTVSLFGTVVYCNFDELFRASMESNLPFTSSVLTTFLGPSQNSDEKSGLNDFWDKTKKKYQEGIGSVKEKLGIGAPEKSGGGSPAGGPPDKSSKPESPSLASQKPGDGESEECCCVQQPPCPAIIEPCPRNSDGSPIGELHEKFNTEISSLGEERAKAECIMRQAESEAQNQRLECERMLEDALRKAEAEKREACQRIAEAERKAEEMKESCERKVREARQQECEERRKREEKRRAALNAALEEQVKAAEKCMRNAFTAAVDSEARAANAIREHIRVLCEVVGKAADPCAEGDIWKAVCDEGQKRQCALQDALVKTCLAREAADCYRKVVLQGLDCGEICDNPILCGYEDKIRALVDEMEAATERTRQALREAQCLEQCEDSVEKAWCAFQNKLSCILPDAQGAATDDLSKNQMIVMLVNTFYRLRELEKQLDKLKCARNDEVRCSVEDSEKRHRGELEKARQDCNNALAKLEQEYKCKMEELRCEMDRQLRIQLKRQSAAHAEHLQDALMEQQKSFERRWDSAFEDGLSTSKRTYLSKMAEAQSRLAGIKEALLSRAQVEKMSKTAQELWLACAALKQRLKCSELTAGSWSDRMKPLMDEVDAIEVSAVEDEFVQSVLRCIPKAAITRGVLPEDALKERFIDVSNAARKVALVGENGAPLPVYILSSLMSMLMVHSERSLTVESVDVPIDVDTLSTHDILDRAKFHLHRDDLIQAVKYMNLLKGAARNIADDWLTEARLHLETRQAADALLAHAAGIGCKEWKDYLHAQEKTLNLLAEETGIGAAPNGDTTTATVAPGVA